MPVTTAKAEFPEQQYTLADLIRAGTAMLGPINQVFKDQGVKEENREFFETVLASLHSPEVMEEFLFRRIQERAERIPDLEAALSEVVRFLDDPGKTRRMIRTAIEEAFPKGPRGRPSNFNPAEHAHRFLEMSDTVLPECELILALKKVLPEKTAAEIIEFLENGQMARLVSIRKHAGFIDELVHSEDFQLLKGDSTRARRLADAIIGKELFGWSPTYSAQRAGEFRRAEKMGSEE
jgi:hypothetical protein